MDTTTMSRCVAFLDALTALPPDDWRRRAAAALQRPTRIQAGIRAELERRCDAFELWTMRDEVNAMCWCVDPRDRGRMREAIADAALAILAGACEEAESARLLDAFADLVPRRKSLAPIPHER